MKSCEPLPTNTARNIPLRGGLNTSPCTSFQPNSSWASSCCMGLQNDQASLPMIFFTHKMVMICYINVVTRLSFFVHIQDDRILSYMIDQPKLFIMALKIFLHAELQNKSF